MTISGHPLAVLAIIIVVVFPIVLLFSLVLLLLFALGVEDGVLLVIVLIISPSDLAEFVLVCHGIEVILIVGGAFVVIVVTGVAQAVGSVEGNQIFGVLVVGLKKALLLKMKH